VHEDGLIVTNAHVVHVGLQLRPGHSGGPLLDGDGRLVGITTIHGAQR